MKLDLGGFPLLVTFDVDAETMWTARDPNYANWPIMMSQGAYSWKVGIWRVLELLKRYGITTTFFVPGLVVQQHQDMIDGILRDGHEIAHHSFTHRWIVNLSPEEEADEMEKGFEAIVKATGRAPRGWRSPAAEISQFTKTLLPRHRFRYSSNFFDDEIPYMLNLDGQRSDIVELPFRYALTDSPFFQFSKALPGRTIASPSTVLEIWKWDFDVLYAEQRMMVLALHPEFSGQPFASKLLDKFLNYALSHSNVRTGPCEIIAEEFRQKYAGAA
jgi:peptidoglycan/xylan/chitin deacetylase (PgdA/CDA1 family)